ncbi:DUF2924 domain-containing protein [Tabrizicola flagellatus]|uniref:DUF2924 domain-containing protein n=1 Tax=Tabrizicola flagellatus TaxID=2593021 RepID=UPI0011F40618|nr:DUF2924 domain-containing protein [Tabrizicola flagellatus]
MNKPDPIPARLAALKTMPTPDLKQQWRDLSDCEPPPFNRHYLESRLGYATTPTTRPDFWAEKFAANVRRDRATLETLAALGRRVATVWECALRKPDQVSATCDALVSWLAAGEPDIEVGEGDLAARDHGRGVARYRA